MPSFTQQEGTLTSLDKRVTAMNVVLEYGGYILNDIANALGLNSKYTIDYTKELPLAKGFKSVEFDSLDNYFNAKGDELRGYILDEVEVKTDISIEDVEEMNAFDGTVIYNCNPQEHFSAFTAKSNNLTKDAYLLGSQQFATAAKLKDGDTICYTVNSIKFKRVFKIDTSLKGTIALNPIFDMGLSTPLLSSYRFSKVDLERVGS
ncbi:NADH-ubiquinone oxidoreductase chain G [hydrothermal vent metagenome]|uniref:NADH-ubiquinone oxidoreductase chain G n=1 Tax=hydrothermal vent metagenome TaxID=652676 RepID=A0A1W1CHM2_9ZZZZ